MTTFPNPCRIPLFVMGQNMTARKPELSLYYPNAAGIDIGSASHYMWIKARIIMKSAIGSGYFIILLSALKN